MKLNINKIWGGTVLLAFAVLLFAMSFGRAERQTETVFDEETGGYVEMPYAEYLSPGKPIQGKMDGGAIDTLAASTGRTFEIPYIFASPWQYEIYMRVKKITGTPNSKVVLDSRTITNGTWTPIDSVSVAGADSVKLHFRLRSAVTYGSQYRIRLVKTGASTLSLKVDYNFKAPNQ